ncbi:UDP-2,3-diacylglucosamine diphosphatase LpxI [candidate division FCPU426 bacterium]|nr:UDP-2,3-diacylglucosamine diphosphatase LpxI [candidate division FCPU426 bacterium]
MALPNKKPDNVCGLIAGWGEFPHLVARALKAQGRQVVAVAFPGETYKDLEQHVDDIHWISIGQLGKMISIFKSAGAGEAVMAGMIRHKQLFANIKLDLKAVALLAGVKDKRADTILRAVAEKLGKAGIKLVAPLPYLTDHLPQRGVLTKRRPTPKEKADIHFGYRLAKHVAEADIGQTVVVRDKAVVAVEAMEGTDACILRSGELTRGGAVVVKVVKPHQDYRFDTPVIGPHTIDAMRKAKAAVLAFDAGKTLFIQKDKTIARANAYKIALVAV